MADETPIVEAPVVVTPAVSDVPVADTQTETPEVRDPNKIYKQEEVDRIIAKAKKNERWRTKKEVEAYYQGRESLGRTETPVTPQAQPEAKVEEEKPPVRDSYDSYEQFLEAKAEFAGRKSAADYRAKMEAEAKQKTERETADKRASTFREKLTAKYADIAERAQDIAHINIPAHMVEAMHESDFGHDILNGFVNDPKELERIAALPLSAALREMGKLEVRYESASPEKPTLTVVKSTAPAPIKAIGGSTVTADAEPSHDKPEAWAAWRNRQIQKKKAGSK